LNSLRGTSHVAGDALDGVREVPRIPSDDELELAALDFLRQRFLSADERMAGLFATLARQMDFAPAQERLSIRHAADQIADIQQRLHAQVRSLPPGGDAYRKIMRSLLQVQRGALDQLTALVEQNSGHEAKAIQQMREAPVTDRRLTNAQVERSPARKVHTPHRQLGRQPRRRVALVELARSHRLTVLGAMGVAAVYAYAHPPGTYTPHEQGRDRATTAAAGGSNDPPKYPASLADADDTTDRKSVPSGTILTRPSNSAAGAASLPTGAVTMQQLEGTRGGQPTEAGKDAGHLPIVVPPSHGLREAGNSDAGEDQDFITSPSRKPSTPAATGEDRAVEQGPPRFVAVVLTHREPDAAISGFAELQQRYPRLLAQRRGEAQPVETTDKGVWHRMVVLPAGSRQSAESLCDQLEAAGYDRCWVKPY
jgi:hypothetical protein